MVAQYAINPALGSGQTRPDKRLPRSSSLPKIPSTCLRHVNLCIKTCKEEELTIFEIPLSLDDNPYV